MIICIYSHPNQLIFKSISNNYFFMELIKTFQHRSNSLFWIRWSILHVIRPSIDHPGLKQLWSQWSENSWQYKSFFKRKFRCWETKNQVNAYKMQELHAFCRLLFPFVPMCLTLVVFCFSFAFHLLAQSLLGFYSAFVPYVFLFNSKSIQRGVPTNSVWFLSWQSTLPNHI